MSAPENTYTISLRRGFGKWKADVSDGKKSLLARGVLSRRKNAQIWFLPNKTRQKLIRRGLLRKQYQLLDDVGNPICSSISKAEKYPLVLCRGSATQWLKVEKMGASNYIFYDTKNVEVAWIKWKQKKGKFSRGEYELGVSQLPSDLRDGVLVIATGMVLFDVADLAAEAASDVALNLG